MENRIYQVRYDGFSIKEIELTYDQYRTQESRDVVRAAVAKEIGVPTHYFKLFCPELRKEAQCKKNVE